MIESLSFFDLELETHEAESYKPWPSGLYSKTLVKNDDLRVLLFIMEPGANLKEHQAGGSITVFLLQGEIRFSVQAENHAIRMGQMLTLGPSIPHSVECLESAAFLLTISWPPAQPAPQTAALT